MARLLSVSVGPPREVECKGKTVRTAVWKSAVRRKVRKLNIDGDGQGDLVGHGSVNLAVAVRLMVNRAPGFGNARLSRSRFGPDDGYVCIHCFQTTSSYHRGKQPDVQLLPQHRAAPT